MNIDKQMQIHLKNFAFGVGAGVLGWSCGYSLMWTGLPQYALKMIFDLTFKISLLSGSAYLIGKYGIPYVVGCYKKHIVTRYNSLYNKYFTLNGYSVNKIFNQNNWPDFYSVCASKNTDSCLHTKSNSRNKCGSTFSKPRP